MVLMNEEQVAAVKECLRASLAAEITFATVVARLSAMGVERYHADYSRQEVTYYLPNGDSLVLAAQHKAQPCGDVFSAAAIAEAVQRSQRNEHTYAEFVQKTMAAGCVGYFVQMAGRCGIYFGRDGDCHVEHFPAVPAANGVTHARN
jgi:uncharacterized protein YbcV (DUF1398 family)